VLPLPACIDQQIERIKTISPQFPGMSHSHFITHPVPYTPASPLLSLFVSERGIQQGDRKRNMGGTRVGEGDRWRCKFIVSRGSVPASAIKFGWPVELIGLEQGCLWSTLSVASKYWGCAYLAWDRTDLVITKLVTFKALKVVILLGSRYAATFYLQILLPAKTKSPEALTRNGIDPSRIFRSRQ